MTGVKSPGSVGVGVGLAEDLTEILGDELLVDGALRGSLGPLGTFQSTPGSRTVEKKNLCTPRITQGTMGLRWRPGGADLGDDTPLLCY